VGEPAPDVCAGAAREPDERRRRPGADTAPEAAPPVCDRARLPLPDVAGLPLPAAATDRWRLVEALGYEIDWRNSYRGGNVFKGDRPAFGQDRFVNLTASISTLVEGRDIPSAASDAAVTAVGRTGMRAEQFFNQSVTLDSVFYRGDTVFRPPDWQWRLTPVLSFSGTRADAGSASGGSIALQALWFEKHLRDVSTQYDFDSLRMGIQPLTSDFRGFLLSDQPLALRLFGTRRNNTFQYNVALLRRLQKNRVRLNDVTATLPDNEVLLANLYWQDFPRAGLTSELIGAYSRSGEPGMQAVRNESGLQTTPVQSPHHYQVAYLGYGLDGHVGRVNTTAVLYGLAGHERESAFTGTSARVRAWFAAAEGSVDFDWRRVRVSLLHASGDPHPTDHNAQGFDSLNASPVFAGADSGYFAHQRWALQTGAFDLKSRDSLLPSLRSASDSGQSNFTNPGLNLMGIGVDADVTPRWRVSVDANQLWFDQPNALSALLQRPLRSKAIGTEFAVNSFWRPWNNQNLILRVSAAALVPGAGYRELYTGGQPYSVFAFLLFTY
jgi:hypothetical protein